MTLAPKKPKARTRLNMQAVKAAVASGSANVVEVAAQMHAPPSLPERTLLVPQKVSNLEV